MKHTLPYLTWTLLALLGCIAPSHAQWATALRINEVMTYNTDNAVDDFGQRNGWIEFFNTSYGTVDIGGCFITTDMNLPKMYPIPAGDVTTKMKPRQHSLFWADNHPTHGTYHVNFTLDSTRSNFVALFDVNGRTLIDSITIPPLKANESFGRMIDGDNKWGILPMTTPSSNNVILNRTAKAERFKENDPSGGGMSIVAMSVVFSALLVLFLCFKQVGKYFKASSKKKTLIAKGVSSQDTVPGHETDETGEVYAAIAMALHEYQNDIHDVEHTVLTIDRVTRNYSPWSSKLYGLRQTPGKL
jgi:Na+-transporting methylmalonyl-CoA/oxaloacetate decarboxylase gamma subunit